MQFDGRRGRVMHPAVNSAKRTRRTGHQVRALILKAAVELFAEHGFAGTSTKEIAQRAAVAEVLLFRHFNNKQGLFDAAVLTPLDKFVDVFTHRWATHRVREEPLEAMVHEFVGMLYGFFVEHKLLFAALLASRPHVETLGATLDDVFERLQMVNSEAAKEFGLPTKNSAVATRLSFGLVMSASVNGSILFNADQPVPQELIIDQLANYVIHGFRMA